MLSFVPSKYCLRTDLSHTSKTVSTKWHPHKMSQAGEKIQFRFFHFSSNNYLPQSISQLQIDGKILGSSPNGLCASYIFFSENLKDQKRKEKKNKLLCYRNITIKNLVIIHICSLRDRVAQQFAIDKTANTNHIYNE